MAKVYTYPHWETQVIDNSIYNAVDTEVLPLFRPIFFMRAQQGPVQIPKYVHGANEAAALFGEGTFDDSTEYFSREALYLNNLFTRQGAFIVRLADADTAKIGSVVLELKVTAKNIPQYKRDVNGQFVYELDDDGNVKYDDLGNKVKVPETNESGAEVTEPGYELQWSTRPLTEDETLKSLKPVTYGTGENSYTVYPMLAAKAKYVGAYANSIGLKLYADLDNIDDTLAYNVGSFPYTFGVVKKTYGADTVSAVKSSLGDDTESFVAKARQTDSRTARNVSFDDIIGNYYSDLPFDVKLYEENFKAVGELIAAVEPDDETITDPYLVNLVNGLDINGAPYAHVVISEDSDTIDLNSSRILYLTGGADGDISDAAIEQLTIQYLKDLPYEELLDQPRYPFTHIIDTGVGIQTKYAFIQFLGTHDAFKLVLSTQDANLGRFNTKAEDLSTGSALYAKCLLQPESIIKGTEVCRAEIYAQAGYLADSNYRGIVPATYDIIGKKSLYASTQRITGIVGGLPSSEVTAFKELLPALRYDWCPLSCTAHCIQVRYFST